jgi:hypothetical protein
MKSLKYLLITAASTAFLAVGATAAQAYVACNADGDCWHTDAQYTAPGVTFNYHPDDWYFHRHWDDGHYHWHDYHEGRGYWRGGVWVTL